MPPKRRNIGPLRTAIDRQGRGSVPARFFGVVGYAGADRCVGPDMVPRGARPRADTWVRPYAGWKAFRNQRGLAQDGTSSKGAEQSPPLAAGCAWGTAGRGHPALRKQHR